MTKTRRAVSHHTHDRLISSISQIAFSALHPNIADVAPLRILVGSLLGDVYIDCPSNLHTCLEGLLQSACSLLFLPLIAHMLAVLFRRSFCPRFLRHLGGISLPIGGRSSSAIRRFVCFQIRFFPLGIASMHSREKSV